MVIGILIGWLAPDFAPNLKPFANIFLRMIKSLIVPLLFSTLVVGIAGHGDDMKKVGRLALRSIIYFEIVTTLALAIGLIAVNLVKPGVGVQLQATSATEEFKAMPMALLLKERSGVRCESPSTRHQYLPTYPSFSLILPMRPRWTASGWPTRSTRSCRSTSKPSD